MLRFETPHLPMSFPLIQGDSTLEEMTAISPLRTRAAILRELCRSQKNLLIWTICDISIQIAISNSYIWQVAASFADMPKE